jgi:hypothetical protein
MDRKLLQQHAAPLVASYTYDTGTLRMALSMGHYLSPAPPQLKGATGDRRPEDKAAMLARLRPTRRVLRGGR